MQSAIVCALFCAFSIFKLPLSMSLGETLTFVFFPSFPMRMKNGDNANGEPQIVEITVYDYFTRHCGIELTFSAYLPCLDVGKPKRPNYLPIEVC